MNEPEYYAGNGLSPIGAFKQGLISQEEYIGFLKGNIIKYVIRAGKKDNAVQDLLKAKSYINFYLELFTMDNEEMIALAQDKRETRKRLVSMSENHEKLAKIMEEQDND